MAGTVVARRGNQFLVVTKGSATTADPAAVGHIVDLNRPGLEQVDMLVQAVLKQGYWQPATDADLEEAKSR